MSKDSEALKEGKQTIMVGEDASLHGLFLKLNEVIRSRQPNDKVFIRNELKLKPIVDVPKHSFKDSCSSAAIIDFSLMQAAFRHFTKISECGLTKNDLQSITKTHDTWKHHYFLENELDVVPNGISEESDLEPILVELHMSEISNDISDPEVQEICNKFSAKALSDALCSMPEDSSQEVSPEKRLIQMNGHFSIKRGVKRKKINAYSRRKKTKKLKLLSKCNGVKLLPRNMKKLSSDSSEDYAEHSIVQHNGHSIVQLNEPSVIQHNEPPTVQHNEHSILQCNELGEVEVNPSTSEVTEKDTQEQKLRNGNLISPFNYSTKIVKNKKAFKYSIRNKTKPKKSIAAKDNAKLLQICKPHLSRNAEIPSTNGSEDLLRVSNAQENKLSEEEKHYYPSEESEDNSFSKLNPTKCISSYETTNEVVVDDQTKNISLQGEHHIDASICIRSCDDKAVENHSGHEMDFSCAENTDGVQGDVNSNDSFLTSDNCKDTSNFQAIDFEVENRPASDKDSPSNQDSQTESLKDSMETGSKPCNQESVKPFIQQQSFDQESVLDYECESDLSDEGHYMRVNSERYIEGDEDSSTIPTKYRTSKVAFEEKLDEMVQASGNEEAAVSTPDFSKDVDMRKDFAANFYSSPTFQKNSAFSDDEEYNSDSEQSFKRRVNSNSPQCRNFKRVSEQPSASSASNLHQVVPDDCIRTLNDCLQNIKYHCENDISKAVNTAGEYLAISDKKARCRIFNILFQSIKDNICLLNTIPEEALKKAFDLLKKYQTDDRWLCSTIIYEYFQEPLLVRFALDLCTVCQKEKIPIKHNAIQAYTNNALSKNAPESILLKFLEYVKQVCKQHFPKPLLCQLLERIPKGDDWCLLPEFEQLCNLLCSLNLWELETNPLQNFVVMCMKNNCWDQVARFFRAWACRGYLSDIVLFAFQSKLEYVGKFFKKLAAAFYCNEDQADRCTLAFGYLGITLMLLAYFKGKSDTVDNSRKYMVNALEVLNTLQKYGVNFYDFHESYYTSQLATKFSTDSFYVAFIATEICLSLERPKDAYHIIKGFEPCIQDLPRIVKDSAHIKKIRLEYLKYLFQLIQLLHDTDQLDTGLKSFHDLLSFLNQEDIDHLLKKEYGDLNAEVIKTLFNEYLVINMNKKLNDNVFKLYQLLLGPCKALLPLDKEVLRGVVVFLSKNNRMDDAMPIFEVGCIRNIYVFKKKITKDDYPWKVNVLSHWTSQEMRLVIEQSLKCLFPALKNKKANVDFNSWYTVRISFKEFHCTPSKINCLMEQFSMSESMQRGNCTIEYAMKRACNILNLIDPDFTWKQNKDHILLTPSTFYNYWTKNYAESKEKSSFQVAATKVLNFGESPTSVTAANAASLEMDHTKTSPHINSSPLKNQLSGAEAFPSNSDLFTRRTSLGSSEKSSPSHTPEKDPATRVHQPFLFRSPISKLGVNTMASPWNNNSHHASARMSQSPRDCHHATPRLSQSPRDSHHASSRLSQSPRDSHYASPRLSQSPRDNHHASPWLSQSPRDSHHASPRLSQSPRASHHASPRQSQSPQNNLIPRSPLTAPPCNISFHRSKQISDNNSHSRFASSSVVNPTTGNCTDQNINLNGVSGLAPPCQKTNSANPGPVQGVSKHSFVKKVSLLKKTNDRTLLNNNPHLSTHISASSSLANHNPELSGFAEALISKAKGKKRVAVNRKHNRNNKKFKSGKLQSVPNGPLNSVGHVVGGNLNAVEMFPVPRNDSSALNDSNTVASLDESLHYNSSLPNHSEVLSPFEQPPKSQLRAKRRLNMNPEIATQKLPPYRIPTPSKQAKVLRPITPIIFNPRCKTPVSFSSTIKPNPQVKRPVPTQVASTNSNKKFKDFLNFSVTIPKNSTNHRIEMRIDNSKDGRLFPTVSAKKTLKKINGPVLQNSTGISNAMKRPKENFVITRNFNQTVVESSPGNIKQSSISVTMNNTSKQSSSQPIFKVPQARRYNDVPENDYQRILTFLKSKVMLKCKTSSSDEQLNKANSLANAFIKNNNVKQLDAKTRKLLFQFAETCIY